MKIRKNEWSDMNEEDYKPKFKTVAEGEQYLYIKDAIYDESTKKYILDLESLAETGGSFKVYQSMLKKDGSAPNYMSLKWMNAVGYACSGIKTVLQADEMKGCVILADVKMEPSFSEKARWEEDMKTKGVSDVRLYPTIRPETISPVDSSIVEDFSTHVDPETGERDQFFIDE